MDTSSQWWKMISSNKFLILLVVILALLVILIYSKNDVLSYALLIIIALLVILFFFKRSTPRKLISEETTILMKPKKLLGKLVFPNNDEFILKDYEKTLGREDFLGHNGGDDLLYIGKEHFKLTRLDDGFYIEDLNTKNGTKINGEDISGLGKIKLKDGDEIGIAGIKIHYMEV